MVAECGIGIPRSAPAGRRLQERHSARPISSIVARLSNSASLEVPSIQGRGRTPPPTSRRWRPLCSSTPQTSMAGTTPDTSPPVHRTGAAPPVWIDLPSPDLESLGDIGRRVGLPLELITYCLLDQRRPEVVPCAAWLYSAWQVPVLVSKRRAGRGEVFHRFVGIKVCLGPAAVVTTQERARRVKRLSASLVPDGDALVCERPAHLLVTLIERVGDAYLNAYGRLAVGRSARSNVRKWRGRQARRAAVGQLLRHAQAHRDAIQTLVVRGGRWLETDDVERLRRVEDRLARLGAESSPPTGSTSMPDNAMTQQRGGRSMEHGLSQVLTRQEKQTRMMGAWMGSQVFTRIDFSDTVFEKARCENASFVAVDLRRADFRGAFLTDAMFLRCELAGARFPGAQLTRTHFISCAGLEPGMVRALRERGARVLDLPVPAVQSPVSRR
jgi:Mg2+ and Co2+ transporter CorA